MKQEKENFGPLEKHNLIHGWVVTALHLISPECIKASWDKTLLGKNLVKVAEETLKKLDEEADKNRVVQHSLIQSTHTDIQNIVTIESPPPKRTLFPSPKKRNITTLTTTPKKRAKNTPAVTLR